MTHLLIPPSPWRLLTAAAQWPVASQRVARSNAQASSCDLARRREERLDVEAYLATHVATEHTA